jgi:hypothetical protein
MYRSIQAYSSRFYSLRNAKHAAILLSPTSALDVYVSNQQLHPIPVTTPAEISRKRQNMSPRNSLILSGLALCIASLLLIFSRHNYLMTLMLPANNASNSAFRVRLAPGQYYFAQTKQLVPGDNVCSIKVSFTRSTLLMAPTLQSQFLAIFYMNPFVIWADISRL